MRLFTCLVLYVVMGCRGGDAANDERDEAVVNDRPGEERDDDRPGDGADTALKEPAPLFPAQINLTASQFCGAAEHEPGDDPTPEHRFAEDLLTEKLGDGGLNGWIHAAVRERGQYLMTYRSEEPGFMSFFKAEQLSLIAANDDVAAALAGMSRHDEITVWGALVPNHSPLRHIRVTAIELKKPFEGYDENSYAVSEEQLEGREAFRLFGKLHAIIDGGRGLVVERKGIIFPVFATDRQLPFTQDLYRGDKLLVDVRVMKHPGRPLHLMLDQSSATPVQVVDAMVHCHGKPRELTGRVVKFVKSPVISVDTYAVRIEDANGIVRNFTFFPQADDPQAFGELFTAISEKMDSFWSGYADQTEQLRNHLYLPKQTVRVRGVMNIESPSQANPQILIRDVDDIEFLSPTSDQG